MPDRLTERFAQFADGVRVRPPAPAEHVRARGEWRGRRDAAIAAIALLVALGSVGTLIGLSVVRGGGPGIQPLGPPRPLPTAIATAFSMPHEGEAGWLRSDDPAAPGAFQPCEGPDVTMPGRVAAVTMTGPGAAYEYQHLPTRLTEQMLLFDGLTPASAALTELGRQVQECHWLGGIQDDTDYGVPLVTATNARLDGKEFATVTLWGNALIVTYAMVTGEGAFFPDFSAKHQVSDRLCATMGLCETPKCFDPVVSPSRPVYHSCPPSAAPPPAGTGPSSRYPEPSPNPASAYPGGISPTPGPSPTPIVDSPSVIGEPGRSPR
jgi:hypothetical protein